MNVQEPPETPSSFPFAEAMLKVLRFYGASHIFSSPGSEWVPLWEALAKYGAHGDARSYINVRHEALAVTLAAAHFRQTGQMGAVLLHTTVGVLHAAMALRSARHERVPMIVLTGETATFGERPGVDGGIQWARLLGDAGGPAGQSAAFVKRSGTVASPETLLGNLQDACRLALTSPQGPVHLSIPLEYLPLCAPNHDLRCPPLPARTSVSPSQATRLAESLLAAESPLVITEQCGRDPQAVPLLVEICETLSVPVVEGLNPVYLNFPRNHQLHQGFEAGELLDRSDLVLVLGCQMPWYPSSRRPAEAKVIWADDWPNYETLPYWGYSADEMLSGDLTHLLRDVVRHLREASGRKELAAPSRAERRIRLHARHAQLRAAWNAQCSADTSATAMSAATAARAIGQTLPAEVIIVEELASQKRALLRHCPRNLPGTFHGRSAGGLGVGLGTGVGIKLAALDSQVAVILGDGSFNYNPVLAAFGCAQQYEAPFLTIILNDGGYSSMKLSHMASYPEGWAARTGRYYGCEIEPAPDYVAIAKAFGGYGERVESDAALRHALRRALKRVQGGQLALLDFQVQSLAASDAPTSSTDNETGSLGG